jgi:hypothetical protein
VITIIKRPLGHKLSTTELSGSITNSSGDALVTTLANHGLSDGDYVYVFSNFDSYNGFKYVDSTGYTTFKLKESQDGGYVEFKQEADISFYVSILNHGWQCVHLPIVYELESSLFPNNTEEEGYNPITIVGQSTSNGYTQLQFSGAIVDPTVYAKIELVGTGPLAGVYQILTVVNNWTVVIDLAYSAANSFTGYLVVKYYDNYAINVNIYAGLSGGHRWEDEKPLELAATKRLIPDDSNQVKFSIDEILRGYINTVNNLTLDTLPNNIDFLVEFYIGYYESYDISDGEDITTFTTEEEVDDFIGQAVNAKNEFKNQYSGHLSDYVSDENNTARWLTDFDRPVAVVGYFFDISFINVYNNVDVVVLINKRLSGLLVSAETLTIENPGKGVIRVPFTPESGHDEYCIQASTPGSSGTTESVTLPALSTWLTRSTGDDIDWTTGATPTVTIPLDLPNTQSTEYLYTPYTFLEGEEYTITINYTRTFISGLGSPRQSLLRILDDSFNTLFSNSQNATSGANSLSVTFTASSITTIIAFKHVSGASVTIDVTSTSASKTSASIQAQELTEQICIDIIEECGTTFNNLQARLTEPGDLRLLE